MEYSVPIWAALAVTEASEYEVTATVALAHASYLLADLLHLSGIFASSAAAIALRTPLRHVPMANRNDVDAFWNAAAYMANAVLFLAAGILISPERVLHEPLLVAITVLAVVSARAIMAVLVVPDTPGRVTVFMAGMRGALPLALAIALPATLISRPQILDAVFATVMATLVIQGIPLKSVVQRYYGALTSVGANTA
ncbi:MAG: cation:proton antiporter [Candidatus Eremiobacteraeota bacterium]|nr:cation:proton antiporter [Candidatus Eremiobacteraeota bacterium]MBC5802756.1 cation:proton antiporter [Candidatus Eremiobacteraeota bacterium]MBC5825612.1 cation:proton antiporter [Candidatus Eremiobacteraeota bacterium]